jgi:hypothetical protein
MNLLAIIFLIITATALFAAPRRWAPLPLLLGACYMTNGQVLLLGPFHFTVLRLLVLFGVIRILTRGEKLPGGFNWLDGVLAIWGVLLIFSSLFHKDVGDALIYRLGEVYNALGIYFLIRVFCQTTEELVQIAKVTAFLLAPMAIEMVNEHLSGYNAFSLFGGVPSEVEIRDGKMRAQGPFLHSILGGTVGAMCAPLFVGIWKQYRIPATIGLVACLCMIYASASSGPIMSLGLAIFAICLWRWKHMTGRLRLAAVSAYILLELFMSDPAYYVMARIDLTGSSTGWHRAELIHSAINHLNEWWLAGTDYTRHWMPYGVSGDENSSDITNQYLAYGVLGGLPVMIVFICALWLAFRYIGQYFQMRPNAPFNERFLVWCVGATLFSHAVTSISIAYWDQSVVFLYLTIALAGSLHATAMTATPEGDSVSTIPDSSPQNDGVEVSSRFFGKM